jgi:hypothetical protein
VAPGWDCPPNTTSFFFSALPGLLFLITGWVAAGPVAGLAYGAAYTGASYITHRYGRHAAPAQVEFHLHQLTRFLLRFATGAAIGVTFGLVWNLPVGLLTVLTVVFGAAVGLQVWLNAPVDVERVSTPAAVLRNDRVATWANIVSFVVALALFHGSLSPMPPTTRSTP